MFPGGGVNLGSAYGAIYIDQSGIDAGLQEAQRAFDNALANVGTRLSQFGDSVANIGGSLTLLTAPLTAFGVTGVRTAATFQQAMTEISARTGLVGEDLERVRQFALQMGADTVFSGQQAADAFLQLLTSGSSVAEAMEILPSVLNAAAASGGDLGQTADTLTDIMAAFGLEAEDAAGVVDSLSRASGSSSATLQDLGQGFANVGNVARNFGLSVDQTAAILAIFSENGIKGAEAGTQLRSMLLNMTRPTEETQAAWTRLGVSMYDADGNVRDLSAVLQELDAALDQLPVDEQNELMYRLAGSYGIMGLSALRSSMSIDEMQAKMQESASAAEIAESKMGDFNVVVDSLLGSIETLQTEALTPFIEATLTPLIQRATDVVNTITAWVQANPELTAQIVRIGAVVAALGPTLLVVGKAISAVGGLASNLSTVFSVLGGPLSLLIGLGTAFVAAYTSNFLGLRDALEPVFNWILDALRLLVTGDFVGGMFGGAMEDSPLVSFFLNLRNTVLSVIEQVIAAVQPFVEAVGTFFSGLFELLGEGVPILDALFAAMLNAFGPEAATAADDLFRGIAVVVNAALGVAQAFFDFLGGAWAIVAPALGELFNWFTQTALPAVVGFVTDVVLPVIGEFISILGRVWSAVAPSLLSLLDWFINIGLPAIVNIINTYVLPAVEAFFNFIGGVWALVEPALSALGNWFLDSALPAIVGFIRDVVVREVEFFINLLRTIWQVVSPPLTSLYNWFRDTFRWIGENFIKPVVDFVGSLIREVERAFDALSRLLGLSNQPFAYTVPERPAVSVQGPTQLPGSQDSGGQGIAGLPYLIGVGAQPELFVPETNGQFFPADQWMRMLAGAGDQYQITVMMPPEALASPALAEQRGRDFGAALAEELRRRG